MEENNTGTLEQIAANLEDFFDPLIDVFEKVSGEEETEQSAAYHFRHFLAELGLLLPPEFEEAFGIAENPSGKYDKEVKPKLFGGNGEMGLIPSLRNINPGTVLTIFQNAEGVITAVIDIKDDVERILDKMNVTNPGTLKNQLVEFGKKLPENLTYHLVIIYLEKNGKVILPVLIFIGFVEITDEEADAYEPENSGNGTKFGYKIRQLNWDNLFGFITDPTEKLKEFINLPDL